MLYKVPAETKCGNDNLLKSYFDSSLRAAHSHSTSKEDEVWQEPILQGWSSLAHEQIRTQPSPKSVALADGSSSSSGRDDLSHSLAHSIICFLICGYRAGQRPDF